MSSAAVGSHSGAGPLSLMSCVRESSPLQDHEVDGEKNETMQTIRKLQRTISLPSYSDEYELTDLTSKKRFWNPKKWFKRKHKEENVVQIDNVDKDVFRSRSTSELSITEEPTSRKRSGSSMHPGLSVSHDSVFHSPNSGSDIELDQAQSSSSLSISHPQIDARLQTELSERLRLRRGRGDTSEDDEGLPHSPCNSPTTTEGLLEKTAIKDLPTKSHSTCSDGSLLSMGSSEMDEESFSQPSRHSSKLSLYEKKVSEQDSDLELGSSAAPLNHSAAHHRVAVRPKRRAPGRKRVPQLSTALPTTPEVNEDSSIRSVSPENITKDTIVQLHSMNKRTFMTDTQLKCSSLPPGLVAADMESNKLNRSRSNAGSKSQDHFAALEEELIEKEEKTTDKSFFDRIFPRRSAKKKKSKEEKIQIREEKIYSKEIVTSSSSSLNQRLESKPIAAPRTGAAARQRIQPIDLPSPSSPDSCRRRDFETIVTKPSPEKSLLHSGTSPLQAELETLFKQRQNMSSPIELSPTYTIKTSESNTTTEINKKDFLSTRQDEIRLKIPGLSSLQQRVLSHHQDDFDDDIDDSGFKSLNEFTDNKIITKPITKSHSFKSTKVTNCEKSTNERFREKSNDEKIQVGKAASLDSVKHLDESKMVEISENLTEIKHEKIIEMMKREEYKNIDETMIDKHFNFNDVTISGPSHTAVVNVSNFQENSTIKKLNNFQDVVIKENTKETTTKESVSITKIQLKRESNQIKQSTVTVPKPLVPEFLNRQLNKVEQRSSSNVVFSTTSTSSSSSSSSSSPRIIEEQIKPKAVFTTNTTISETTMNQRKFSQEDIEIVEKTIDEDQQQQQQQQKTPSIRYKKNENLTKTRKPSTGSVTSTESPKCEKSISRSHSVSLDSLKGETDNSDKSSQDSLDKLDEKTEGIKTKEKISTITESVVLRKKSLVKQKTDDEPELMKVFARRSLKLKDNECDVISQQINSLSDNNGSEIKTTRDSDKENQIDSPKEERKKSITKLEFETKSNREPLTETKITPTTTESIKSPTKKESPVEQKFTETSEVVLRKPINNIFNYQRTISLNPVKNTDLDDKKLKKNTSFNNNNNNDRRRIESWSTTNIKNNDLLLDKKISQDEIILTKSDIINNEFITETKNFNQRKAEWEKRAQEAQKKSVP